MKTIQGLILSVAVVAALTACSSEKMAEAARSMVNKLDGGQEQPAEEGARQGEKYGAAVEAAEEASAPAASAAFDINSVPISTVALGDFPYITVPEGYKFWSLVDKDRRFARFPFWVAGQSRWVEGRIYSGTFYHEERGQFSRYEVQRNMENLMAEMSAVKVGEGTVPNEVYKSWGDEITSTDTFYYGLGNVERDPVATYLLRRDDGNIWIQMNISNTQGDIVVGKEEGFKQTAKLLPASELKRQIDATGKVALQVNFAVDKTDILPESQPQIAQVLELLRQDDTLKLGVHGHTDNTGSSEHNQTLSDGRARAVVAALTSQGISAERLSAKGFGDTQPVADNGSEQGRAQNRRVELVKQ